MHYRILIGLLTNRSVLSVRHQVQLTKPLYEKRARIVSQIPNFWPLVLEQAPPDIDEYIQPTDSALLLTSLTNISVSHFEIENGGNGDPRSVSIRWEFTENEYFEDRVLEKKFWYRRALAGYSGLVSEPVEIRWKEGKDLTDGLLSMVKSVWDEEQQAIKNGTVSAIKKEKKPLNAKQQALKEKIQSVGLGGLSFFAWFGFIGDRISAEESQMANAREAENQRRRKAGQALLPEEDEDEDDDDDEEDDLEIFPDGDGLALAITDDLWPGALKYFSKFTVPPPISMRCRANTRRSPSPRG